jgi:hypothetical protein
VSNSRDEIAAIAEQFLNLPAAEREIFINVLAQRGGTAEIIPIFEHFHQNLLENENV